MKSLISVAISLALGLFASVSVAADVDAIAQNCNDCHGDNGVSQWSDVPTIAGIPEFVQSDALYLFRDGDRPCGESKYRQGDTSRPATTMCQVVADFDDDTIDAIAAHFAGLPFVAAKQDFDADLAAKGMAVHEEHCTRCHSEGGSNPEDEASILAGQQMGYLKHAFAEFKSGEREQPEKMQENFSKLSDDDMTALLNYYASQQ